MARYLEYNTTSGRIVCEIISQTLPEPSNGCAFLQIPEDELINTSLYAVKNGKLIKILETNEERLEHERIHKENIERVQKRLNSLAYETILAILDTNKEALKQLKAEFKELKPYLS